MMLPREVWRVTLEARGHKPKLHDGHKMPSFPEGTLYCYPECSLCGKMWVWTDYAGNEATDKDGNPFAKVEDIEQCKGETP